MKLENSLGFSNLLSAAIGNESQVVFAQKCGISKEHLNRMLSGKATGRPSKTTLKKIAANSDLSYDKLLAVCGYESTNHYNLLPANLAEKTIQSFLSNANVLTKSAKIYPSVKTFVEELLLISGESKADLKFSRVQEYEGSHQTYAEYFQVCSVEFPCAFELCTAWFVIYYCLTKGGKAVIVGFAADGHSLLEANAFTQKSIDLLCRDGADISAMPCVYILRKNKAASERLMKALFYESDAESYLVSNIGFGFALPTVPKNLRDFLDAHQSIGLIPGVLADKADDAKAMLNSILRDNKDPVEVLKECECQSTVEEGYAAAIANIMSEETGFDFMLWSGAHNKAPVIMVDDCSCDVDEIIPILHDYAKELGIKRYGECVAYTEYHLDPRMQFSVED